MGDLYYLARGGGEKVSANETNPMSAASLDVPLGELEIYKMAPELMESASIAIYLPVEDGRAKATVGHVLTQICQTLPPTMLSRVVAWEVDATDKGINKVSAGEDVHRKFVRLFRARMLPPHIGDILRDAKAELARTDPEDPNLRQYRRLVDAVDTDWF
jgi:hypothetical protein